MEVPCRKEERRGEMEWDGGKCLGIDRYDVGGWILGHHKSCNLECQGLTWAWMDSCRAVCFAFGWIAGSLGG